MDCDNNFPTVGTTSYEDNRTTAVLSCCGCQNRSAGGLGKSIGKEWSDQHTATSSSEGKEDKKVTSEIESRHVKVDSMSKDPSDAKGFRSALYLQERKTSNLAGMLASMDRVAATGGGIRRKRESEGCKTLETVEHGKRPISGDPEDSKSNRYNAADTEICNNNTHEKVGKNKEDVSTKASKMPHIVSKGKKLNIPRQATRINRVTSHSRKAQADTKACSAIYPKKSDKEYSVYQHDNPNCFDQYNVNCNNDFAKDEGYFPVGDYVQMQNDEDEEEYNYCDSTVVKDEGTKDDKGDCDEGNGSDVEVISVSDVSVVDLASVPIVDLASDPIVDLASDPILDLTSDPSEQKDPEGSADGNKRNVKELYEGKESITIKERKKPEVKKEPTCIDLTEVHSDRNNSVKELKEKRPRKSNSIPQPKKPRFRPFLPAKSRQRQRKRSNSPADSVVGVKSSGQNSLKTPPTGQSQPTIGPSNKKVGERKLKSKEQSQNSQNTFPSSHRQSKFGLSSRGIGQRRSNSEGQQYNAQFSGEGDHRNPKASQPDSYAAKKKITSKAPDAMFNAADLQERLFREARNRMHARMEEECRFHVLDDRIGVLGCAARTVFDHPVEDLTKLPSDHWTWSDPYSRLGLPLMSDVALVKRHFRRLALLYHPDKIRGDNFKSKDVQKRFHAIKDAYEKLTRRP